jgi:alpha,alpha-trehalose phosphorylase
VADRLGVTDQEVEAWRKAAQCIVIPYDDELKVHQQSQGFTRHAKWDFEHTRDDQYPLLLHFPYFNLYRSQVLKQADLVLAIHLRGDAFTPEEKLHDFDYYEQITVRDSSLSACSQAVVAAEVGHLDLAYRYLGETAFMDLANIERNVRDGLHLAALSGGWIAVVAGFAGFRDHAEVPRFNPRLPEQLSRIRFGMTFRGSHIRVDIERDHTTYSVEGQARELRHGEGRFTVKPGESVRLANEKVPECPTPPQPRGREPFQRGEPPQSWHELASRSGRMWDSV